MKIKDSCKIIITYNSVKGTTAFCLLHNRNHKLQRMYSCYHTLLKLETFPKDEVTKDIWKLHTVGFCRECNHILPIYKE